VTDSILISSSTADDVVSTPRRARVYVRKALALRFWSKVNKNGPTPSHMQHLGPCWVWIGSSDGKGYGGIRDAGRRGRLLKAHRVSWSMHSGRLTDWMIVCHRCDNPACVRPEHLFVGTQRDNVLDAVSKGRTPAKMYPERVVRGERHRSAKLTQAQVDEIRSLHGEGVRQVELAKRFGVTQANISSLLNGKSWRGMVKASPTLFEVAS
jgi:hypothetical protein